MKLAESIKAKAIIVPTRRGRMAGYVTNCHPQAPIICAFTNDSRTRRQLVLNRNVLSFRINFSEDPEKTLATAANILIERAEFTPEDRLVVISDALAGSGIDAIRCLRSAEYWQRFSSAGSSQLMSYSATPSNQPM